MRIRIVFNLKRGVGYGERSAASPPCSVHSRLFDIEGPVSPEWVPALFLLTCSLPPISLSKSSLSSFGTPGPQLPHSLHFLFGLTYKLTVTG